MNYNELSKDKIRYYANSRVMERISDLVEKRKDNETLKKQFKEFLDSNNLQFNDSNWVFALYIHTTYEVARTEEEEKYMKKILNIIDEEDLKLV